MNGENHKLYHEDNLYILGKWFARERHLKGFSTRGLSRASNITASLISDIENQKIRPNMETIRQLYHELDIEFVVDINHLTAVQENIMSLYYAVYDQNLQTIHNFFTALKNQIPSLRYSPIAIDLLIIEAIIPTMISDFEVPSAFHALKHHLSYLSTTQKERYYIALGYQQIAAKDYLNAIDSLHQAISFHREGRGFAVAHELIALIYSKLFDPLKAIEYGSKASKMHAKWSNISRKIETDFIQIKSQLEVNQMHQAQTLISNLSYVIVESNQKQWFELKAFEAFLHYKLGSYTESLDILEHIPKRNFYLDLLQLELNLALSKKEESFKHYQSLIKTYPRDTHPLEHAISVLVYHQENEKPHELTQEAQEYLLNHIQDIEELDVLKKVVECGLNHTLKKTDQSALVKWVKLSQKLIKNGKI